MPRARNGPRREKKVISLTAREIRFAQLFAEQRSLAKSYLQAGFPDKGNDHANAQAAFRLVKKRELFAYIQELKQEAADVARLTINQLAKSLAEQAYCDRTQVFDAKGKIKPPAQWPLELRSIIAGIEVENIEEWVGEGETRKKVVIGQNWKVRFERATEAKKMLADWFGVQADKGENAATTQLGASGVVVIKMGLEDVEQPAVEAGP